MTIPYNIDKVLLIRGACLWGLIVLLQVWDLTGVNNQLGFLQTLFQREPTRVIQAVK